MIQESHIFRDQHSSPCHSERSEESRCALTQPNSSFTRLQSAIHNPKSAIFHTRSGFTLLELVTALFILTFGLFGVLTMYHVGLDAVHDVNESAIALRAVENELETLRAQPFDSLKTAEAAPFISTPANLDVLTNAQTTVSIKDAPNSSRSLKQVIARIAWSGRTGRTIEKSLTTLIADRGQN